MAVYEICTFRVVAPEPEFLRADARMQTEFAYRQPGLMRRTTARGDGEAEWLVLTIWRTVDAAAAAAEASGADPVAAEFWASVDAGSVSTRRYTSLD